MSKIGGGTSAYFGDIRPRGSAISNNGKSDGSFNFSKLFDTIIDVISQGTSRKGQFAGYIDIDHGDIEEWLEIHSEGVRDLLAAVAAALPPRPDRKRP